MVRVTLEAEKDLRRFLVQLPVQSKVSYEVRAGWSL